MYPSPSHPRRECHFLEFAGGRPAGSSFTQPLSPVTDLPRREVSQTALSDTKRDRCYVSSVRTSAWVETRTSSSGRKFIQTYANGMWRDNLLALPEY